MTTTITESQQKLNDCALIIRKYNLGDSNFFFSKFSNSDFNELKSSWDYALKKIQSREIIKNSSSINIQEGNVASEKAALFKSDITEILSYLNSEFDVTKLKLTDEKIERNLRNKLATTYIHIISSDLQTRKSKNRLTRASRLKNYLQKKLPIIVVFSIVGAIASPRVIDGLTPVEELAYKIHEKSKYGFNGSVCRDGHISHSQGRGTCSWHKGVRYKFSADDYSKSMEECRKEAKEISWRD